MRWVRLRVRAFLAARVLVAFWRYVSLSKIDSESKGDRTHLRHIGGVVARK